MNQPVKRIYVDTSVFGGVHDDEFKEPSKKFFEQSRQGFFELVISGVVEGEIAGAPENVRHLYERTLQHAEIAEVTEQALYLQNAYLKAKIVSRKWSDDALHVATATVSVCDMIASWNFRHIVHYDKIPMYNAVNILHGYKSIAIYSPLEIIQYEKE